MAPPNFSHHKKRKSRSRGLSAKRSSRTKSKASDSSDKSNPHRSFSCDQASAVAVIQPSATSESDTNYDQNILLEGGSKNDQSLNSKAEVENLCKSKDSHNQRSSINSQYKIKKATQKKLSDSTASSVLTLANKISEPAIATAGSDLRNCHENCSTNDHLNKIPALGVSSKLLKGSCSDKMVSEEDTLDNLCKLLDRLDAAYCSTRSTSITNSVTSPSRAEQNGINTFGNASKLVLTEGTEAYALSPSNNVVKSPTKAKPGIKLPVKAIKSPKKESAKNDTKALKTEVLLTKTTINEINNEPTKENNLTPEEKQALRKAKKEGKKQSKVINSDKAASKSEDVDMKVASSNKLETLKKSKTDLKQERREKQEAQRAAKALQEKEKKPVIKVSDPTSEPPHLRKKTVVKRREPPPPSLPIKRLPLLGHLTPQIEEVDIAQIHPAIRIAGLSMKDRTIDGCNARVLAALSAISALIEDYKTPPSCDLSRDLSDTLAPNIRYLNSCRPIHEPMNNAIRFVKREIYNIDQTIPELQAKEELLSSIKNYIDQNLILASKTICQNTSKIIENGDVILTFGYSSLVLDTIKEASVKLKNISIIVVDKPVPASGANMLNALSKLGIKLYYRIIPDITNIMSSVTKIIIEAEGVVLNGAVLGICGTAGLALEASIRSVPFIVLSHTYKFCNIDLTDSLVVNELGDPEDIMNNSHAKYMKTFSNWRDYPTLNIVNLVYDVTPAEMVSVLVTERHIVPTTVVPTIIKKNFADILGHD